MSVFQAILTATLFALCVQSNIEITVNPQTKKVRISGYQRIQGATQFLANQLLKENDYISVPPYDDHKTATKYTLKIVAKTPKWDTSTGDRLDSKAVIAALQSYGDYCGKNLKIATPVTVQAEGRERRLFFTAEHATEFVAAAAKEHADAKERAVAKKRREELHKTLHKELHGVVAKEHASDTLREKIHVKDSEDTDANTADVEGGYGGDTKGIRVLLEAGDMIKVPPYDRSRTLIWSTKKTSDLLKYVLISHGVWDVKDVEGKIVKGGNHISTAQVNDDLTLYATHYGFNKKTTMPIVIEKKSGKKEKLYFSVDHAKSFKDYGAKRQYHDILNWDYMSYANALRKIEEAELELEIARNKVEEDRLASYIKSLRRRHRH